jgi:hypothetical protein
MKTNEKVKAFLTGLGKKPHINGKHLYNKYGEAKKSQEGEYIKLSRIYKHIYFLYLDFDTYGDFVKTIKIGEQEYVGYYYSPKRHTVKTFRFLINYDSIPFRVKVLEFHDTDMNDPEYSGNGKIKRNNLHMNLSNGDDHELKIIIHTGLNENNVPQTREVFFGIMLGVSLNVKIPIAFEIVLIKADISKKWEPSITRYLMLERNCFVGHEGEYDLPVSIKANGELVNKIEHMVGTWRIWAYSREQKFISQSRFVIEAGYSAILYTPPPLHTGPNIFTCLLNTHSAVNEELFVSGHPQDSDTLMYYTIIDIRAKTNKYSEGVFSSAGVEGSPSKCSYIALYKDDSPFEPAILNVTQVNDLAQNDNNLKRLRDTLFTHERVPITPF